MGGSAPVPRSHLRFYFIGSAIIFFRGYEVQRASFYARPKTPPQLLAPASVHFIRRHATIHRRTDGQGAPQVADHRDLWSRGFHGRRRIHPSPAASRRPGNIGLDECLGRHGGTCPAANCGLWHACSVSARPGVRSLSPSPSSGSVTAKSPPFSVQLPSDRSL